MKGMRRAGRIAQIGKPLYESKAGLSGDPAKFLNPRAHNPPDG